MYKIYFFRLLDSHFLMLPSFVVSIHFIFLISFFLISRLQKTDVPRNVDKELCRATSFLQSYRYCSILRRALGLFNEYTPSPRRESRRV